MSQINEERKDWVYTFLIPFLPLKVVVAIERQEGWRPCFRLLERQWGTRVKHYLMVGGFHYYTAMRLSFWGR